ncbi:MAG TPA: hypothetical protein VNN07_03890 [Candidatus Tectomicrobia bacterium]|nr:hypothetical protein [Candidatus Tectomicrobia bacterium]
MDLGPATGSNIAFLGERTGCRIHVKDLYADLDHHAREGTLDRLPEFLGERFTGFDERVDAVLCWDIFDYLAPAAATALAGALTRTLRRGGTLLAFFGAGRPGERSYTRYVIVDEAHLRHRSASAACSRERALENREVLRLFAGLEVVDSVLLRSGAREVIFQKPNPR